MKRLLVLAFVCLAVVSCKKDDDNRNGNSNSCSSISQSNNRGLAIPDSCSIEPEIGYYNMLVDGVVFEKCGLGGYNSVSFNDVQGSDYGGQTSDDGIFFVLYHPDDYSNISQFLLNTDYDFLDEYTMDGDECYGTMYIQYNEGNDAYISTPMNDLNNSYNHIQSVDYMQDNGTDKEYKVKGYIKTILHKYGNSSITKSIEGSYVFRIIVDF